MIADPYTAFAAWFDSLYAAMGTKPEVYQPKLVMALGDLITERALSTILDCACGTGDPIIGLAKFNPSLSVVGTDGNRGMLDRCIGNSRAEGLLVADVGQRPRGCSSPIVELGLVRWGELPQVLRDRRFDLATCTGHAIFHQRTRRKIVETLENMMAVVRPGGHVLADTLLYAPDLRSEVGRNNPDHRGTLAADHPLNPLGSSIDFTVICDYVEDEEAVRGVLQTKTLEIVREEKEQRAQVDSIVFEGAPFHIEDLETMMEEAGLCEIELFVWNEKRYRGAIGRCPG